MKNVLNQWEGWNCRQTPESRFREEKVVHG